MKSYLLLALCGLIGVVAQTSHTVQVGREGSFFNPPTISVQLNDTITFVFSGSSHSIVQSSFESPCTPLRGGFRSGRAGLGDNVGASPPTWDLVVTNVSQPIWFFCDLVRPASHCTSGMVGVINPPSIAVYESFVQSAKAVVGTPAPRPTVSLTGIGAFATAPPTVSSSSSTTSSSITSDSTTSSSEPTPTPETTAAAVAESGGKSNKGAIIGGSVAGAVLLVVFLIITYFYFLRRKRDDATLKEFFEYKSRAPPVVPIIRSNGPPGFTPSTFNFAGTRALPPSAYRPSASAALAQRSSGHAPPSSDGDATSISHFDSYHNDTKVSLPQSEALGYGAGVRTGRASTSQVALNNAAPIPVSLTRSDSTTLGDLKISGHAYAIATPITSTTGIPARSPASPLPSAPMTSAFPLPPLTAPHRPVEESPLPSSPAGRQDFTVGSLAREIAAVLRDDRDYSPGRDRPDSIGSAPPPMYH